MRILLSALLVVLISTAVVPFTSGAYAPDPPQAPVSQNADLPQLMPDTGNTPSPQATVPLDVYLSQIKQDTKDYAALNTAIIGNGLTGLGLFAAILALSAFGISWFTSRTYRAEIKEKKMSFEKYEKELKELLAKGKEHYQSLSDMVEEAGNKEKFSKNIIASAKEKIAKGTGVEVLWAEAILAQNKGHWDKAHAFWTSILAKNPDNISALFGAALASASIYVSRGKRFDDLKLLYEGKEYLQKIPDSKRNFAVWNNLGVICSDISEHSSGNDKKIELLNAANYFEHAVECNKNNAQSWEDWGTALASLATIASDTDEKIRYLNMAEEKYLSATNLKPMTASVWDNWGNIYLQRAALTKNDSEKKQFLINAEEKLRRAVECDPKGVRGLYNLACAAALQSNVTECIRLLQKAYDGGALSSISLIEQDADFDQIRHLKEFKDFIVRLKKKGSSSS